ncbi:hypothetical protein FQA39_LY01098 [Lamprigera yunnana]|nr:hypothetical protein FQA39_LY01098 [Lamprigera yunnana]
MVVSHHVEGYDAFCEFIKKFENVDENVHVYFSGSKLPSGTSWCDDCVKAFPIVEKTLTQAGENSHFIYVEVGDRETWKDPDCPFRKDKRTRLLVVPTLVRWGQPQRLEGEQCEKEELKITDHLESKRQLFLDIQTRGPRAFSNLVLALQEIGQNNLAVSLDPTMSHHIPVRSHTKPFILPTNIEEGVFDPREIQALGQNDINNHINITTEPLKVKVQLATQFYDEVSDVPTYNTHSKKRGAVLIINIINYINDVRAERKGADVDGRNLKDLFLQMGFVVESYTNLNSNEIMNVVTNFKMSSKIVGCDMAFIIIMGHGKTNKCIDISEVIGTDNESVSSKWIEEQFNNMNCRALQNKPKIFMYQMCRGDFLDFGTPLDNIESDSGVTFYSHTSSFVRTCSDMLIAHSTLPGTASHRDVYRGSWYMNLFCEIMMDRACNTHLENIFKIIDSKLETLRSGKRTMQTSMYTNIGFKTCYVHPGIYLDGQVIKYIHDNLIPQTIDLN